jgi:predicted RNA-binding Zn-ribbon protein involved in translation (DUF1610 family)
LARVKTAGSPTYQQRVTEFERGQRVFPFFTDEYHAGTVVAVWPAIGMVDVEFPQGYLRMPVEELQRVNDSSPVMTPDPNHNSIPGGAGTVPVSAGPFAESVSRVARAHVKQAMYWGAVDRKYRATKSEIESGAYTCPKCGEDVLKKAIYKRDSGASDKLYGCPACLFLIKRCDIIGDPEFVDPKSAKEPFATSTVRG